MELIYVYKLDTGEVKVGHTMNDATARMDSYCKAHNLTPVRNSLTIFGTECSKTSESVVHAMLRREHDFKKVESTTGAREVFSPPEEMSYEETLSTIDGIMKKHGGKKLSAIEYYELTGIILQSLSKDEKWAVYDAIPRNFKSTVIDNEWYELSFGGPNAPTYIDTYPYEERGEVRPKTPEAQFAINPLAFETEEQRAIRLSKVIGIEEFNLGGRQEMEDEDDGEYDIVLNTDYGKYTISSKDYDPDVHVRGWRPPRQSLLNFDNKWILFLTAIVLIGGLSSILMFYS